MSDKISLQIGDRRIEKFVRYRIEADLYTAADAFSLEFGDPGVEIDPGQLCRLYVNGRLELTGIIDRVEEGTDRSGNTLLVEGRDLMGLLVDSYVEEFPDLQDITLKALAEQLLKKVPFINRKEIAYQTGIAGAEAGQTGGNDLLGIAHDHAKVEPGQTIFEVLKDYARGRGAMFFSLPDGGLVFGRPKAKGKPLFRVAMRLDGAGNNAMSAKRIRDISRRYSKLVILGSRQGTDQLDAGNINVAAEVTDSDVPFHKPLVKCSSNDGQSPVQEARMLLEQQRAQGFQLVYRMARHSQNGRNYTINELCQVSDERRRISGIYLIYGRVFELSKDDGPTTELRLGLPGAIA